MENKTIARKLLNKFDIFAEERPETFNALSSAITEALDNKDAEFAKITKRRSNKVLRFFKNFLKEIGFFEVEMGYDNSAEMIDELKKITGL